MIRSLIPALALTVLVASHPLAQSAPGATTTQPVKTGPLLNLNTASASDLEALPGIGAKVAARIVDYREKKGPFKKIEELMNIQGVGEKSFLKLRSQITVGAKADAAGQQ